MTILSFLIKSVAASEFIKLLAYGCPETVIDGKAASQDITDSSIKNKGC